MAYQEEEASGRITELEQENRNMKRELEEFRAESSHLKNQQATVRRLEERNRQLEQQMEEKVKEMVAIKQQVMAEESQKSTEPLKERKHQLHEQLRAAKENVQEMQKIGQVQVFDQLFDELFDLRAKSEEHRGAKETEVELLTDEVDRAEARLTALEREKENLKAQLAAVGSRQDEDLSERTTFEASLSAKEKIISELHTELHAVEIKLKANRVLNAEKKGVVRKVPRVLHGSTSALINAGSTDEAAGQRGMNGTRKLVSDICVGDGGGWRCKQDGPFRFKKVKQLRDLEHGWRREALIRCPNMLVSGIESKELESRRAPSQQVEEEGGGWEVGPTTVFKKPVVDSEARQTAGRPRCGTSSSGRNEVSGDGKESRGMGRAPGGREGTAGASRIKGFGLHGAQSHEVQRVETSVREECGGSRGVFERHKQSASSAPGGAVDGKGKQLKWVRTRSSNATESDTHEDFLSTPQQKALSALADRCRGGGERGRLEAIEEQTCGSRNSSKEDFGTGVENLYGNSGNHGEAPHNNDNSNEKRDGSSEGGGGAAGCAPQAQMHIGRVVMELVSRDAGGRVARCLTEEGMAEPHEGSGEGDGGDVRATNLKHVGSDAVRVGQSQGLRLLGQKEAPAYKYNAPVRKKGERELLVGVECKQCQQFYEAVQAQDRDGIAENRCGHFQEVSRHRYFFPPPATPDGFWNIGFDTDGQNNE